jgi:Recombinase zinc beta ribbon domain
MMAPLLRNPIYMGRFESDGQRCHWPPLVDDETSFAAQRAIEARRRARRAEPGRFPLSSLLVCPQCGSRMSGETLKATPGSRRKRDVRGYRCEASRHRVGQSCSARADANQIERQTFDALGGMLDALQDATVQRHFRQEWTRLTAPDTAEMTRMEKRRHLLEMEIEQGQRAISAATRLFALSEIDKSAYDGMVREEQRANDQRRIELEDLQVNAVNKPALPSIDSVLDSAGGWAGILNSDKQDLRLVREVLSLLVQRIVPQRTAWGRYQAHIEWTPLGSALANTTRLVT